MQNFEQVSLYDIIVEPTESNPYPFPIYGPMTFDEYFDYIEFVEEQEQKSFSQANVLKEDMFMTVKDPSKVEEWNDLTVNNHKDEKYKKRKTEVKKQALPLGFSYCTYHDTFEPIENFGKHNSTTNGLHAFCRKAHQEYDKQRRENDPDYVIYANAVTHARTDARKYDVPSTFNIEESRRLFYRTGGFMCEISKTLTKGSIEHIRSMSTDGPNVITNIAVISFEINNDRRSRSYFDILEDIAYCDRFNIDRDKLARLLQRKAFENNMSLEEYRQYLAEQSDLA